ncbi:hypothetical protein ACF061_37645 [Streptomyces sp. NPDC015220]|uniref:hypothetical protein n=1 Tax=Streptomyces sp. NPDC015220 TaxID=3364947 RepID=UPI0037009F96
MELVTGPARTAAGQLGSAGQPDPRTAVRPALRHHTIAALEYLLKPAVAAGPLAAAALARAWEHSSAGRTCSAWWLSMVEAWNSSERQQGANVAVRAAVTRRYERNATYRGRSRRSFF